MSPSRPPLISAFLASFILCFLWTSAKADRAVELFSQTGASQSPVAVAIHAKLARQWGEFAGLTHFDRAGYFQIFLGLIGNPVIFPYFAGFAGSSKLRFLNFGAAGFFVGKVASEEKSWGMRTTEQIDSDSVQSVASGREAFEVLEWGATYVNPVLLRDSHSSLRRDASVSSGAALRSFAAGVAAQVSGVTMSDMRDAYALMWSGGTYCLAAGLKKSAVPNQNNPPSWMKCYENRAGALVQSGASPTDESFFAALEESEAAGANMHCHARGVVGGNGLSAFGKNAAGSHCLLYKSPFEERPGFRTKLHCLDVPRSRHLWKNLEFVDFAVESAKPGRYFVLESRYAPPRVTQLELDEQWSQTISGGESRIPGASGSMGGKDKGPPRASVLALPSEEYGQYECVSSRSTKDAGARLFLVPAAVYGGQRAVDVDEDLVYIYHFDATAIQDSEILTWRQVMSRYPKLDAFPPLKCAFESAIDVKCGIRVLQASLQLHWEVRTGVLARVAAKNVQTALFALDRAMLTRVRNDLGNWALKNELALLLEETESLLQDRKMIAPKRQLRVPVSPTPPWSSYLSVPEGFWAMPQATPLR